MWRVRVWEQAVLVPCVIGSWRFTYTLLVMVSLSDITMVCRSGTPMCMITEYRLPRRVANYAGVNACGRCRANVSLCLFAAGSGVFPPLSRYYLAVAD